MSEHAASSLDGLWHGDRSAPVRLGSGQRLPLTDTKHLWVVESGRVEVYYAERHRVHGVGSRRFLLEAKAGEILIGFGAGDTDLNVEVFAIGFDAQLRAVEGARFSSWVSQADNENVGDTLVADWIGRLASKVSSDRPASRQSPISFDEIVNVPANEMVRSEERVCWVARQSGACSMLGRSDLRLGEDEVWPVAGELWLLPEITITWC